VSDSDQWIAWNASLRLTMVVQESIMAMMMEAASIRRGSVQSTGTVCCFATRRFCCVMLRQAAFLSVCTPLLPIAILNRRSFV